LSRLPGRRRTDVPPIRGRARPVSLQMPRFSSSSAARRRRRGARPKSLPSAGDISLRSRVIPRTPASFHRAQYVDTKAHCPRAAFEYERGQYTRSASSVLFRFSSAARGGETEHAINCNVHLHYHTSAMVCCNSERNVYSLFTIDDCIKQTNRMLYWWDIYAGK